MKMGVGGELLEAALPADLDSLEREMVDLRNLIDRLEVRFSRCAALSFQLQADAWDETNSPYRWLRDTCKIGSGQAAQRLDVGSELPNLPRAAEALERGEIGFAHLVVIAETSQAVRGQGREFDEAALLDVAREKDLRDFRDACHHLRHASDPDGFAEGQVAEREQCFLDVHMSAAGGAHLKGYVDREGAAALRTALRPLAQRAGAADFRSAGQRRAEALVEMARHALDAGLLAGRPHLQVTASYETLRGLAGTPAGEMESSLPISSETVRRLACDCSLTRVVFGPQSQVIDVGRTTRTVSGSRRLALMARDRHCRWPGCERPASWSDAHHLVHWAKGGETTLDNLVLLCQRHHWMAHEGGWLVLRSESGQVLAVAPTSTDYASWIRGPDAA